MKKVSLLIFTIFISLVTFTNVHASSANISVSSNKSRVIVGETVTITVKVSSSSALGSWKFDVSPSSNLQLTDSPFGGLYVVDYGSGSTKSKSYTFKFKATSSGTGSVSIKNSQVIGYDELSMSVSNGSTSFKTMTQAELNASLSKNNYLSSLSIEGYELDFDRDTLEYNVEVENGVTSIEVKANKADRTASVKGTGTVEISEGINVIKVVVTAQNGSTRIYTINITVKELSPIEVTVDEKKYTVIRKKEFMPEASLLYEESTTTIGEEVVPSYYNSVTNFTLLGLKDEQGNTELFLYQDGKCKKYEELAFNQMRIFPIETDEIIAGYAKGNSVIGQKNVTIYEKENHYPLIYGLNLETGEKGFYTYDSKENTLQRYQEEVIDTSLQQLYFYCAVGAVGLLVLTYFIMIIVLIHNGRKKKAKLERTMQLQAISQLPEKEKEEVLAKTMVDIKGVETLSKKEQKQQEKLAKLEQKRQAKEENLLGKTMVDITGITLEEAKVTKKEKKKKKKS